MPTWKLLLTAGLSAAGASPYAALQPPGTFHGDEPVAHDGEAWLALRRQGSSAALLASRLRVRAVRDEVLDGPGQTSGREVSSAIDGAVMFLRGANLQAGPVVVARVVPAEREPATPLRYAIDFDGQHYRIATSCTPAPARSVEQLQFDCQVMLEHDGRRQRLFDIGGYTPAGGAEVMLGDDGNAHLIFAGDLDRDGALDLIVDASNHYNVSMPTLFLSSRAAPGELVHQAARYDSVGC